MSRLTGLELAEAFSDFVNGSNSHEHEEFINGFNRQHRTLQQSMMRTMMAVIENCAEPDYGRDGRNQGTHDLAKILVKGYKDSVSKEFAAQHFDGKTTESDEKYIASEHCVPSKALGFI
jgi:hypothetical protein